MALAGSKRKPNVLLQRSMPLNPFKKVYRTMRIERLKVMQARPMAMHWAGVLAAQRQAVAPAQQTPMQANQVLQMALMNLLRQQQKR